MRVALVVCVLASVSACAGNSVAPTCGVRRDRDEHCRHLERDDRCRPTTRPPRSGWFSLNPGPTSAEAGIRRPWAGGTNQRRGQRILVQRSVQVLWNGVRWHRLYRNGGRGRAGRRLDDGVDESERGRRRLVPGAAADWSQDRRSASVNRPARDARAGRPGFERFLPRWTRRLTRGERILRQAQDERRVLVYARSAVPAVKRFFTPHGKENRATLGDAANLVDGAVAERHDEQVAVRPGLDIGPDAEPRPEAKRLALGRIELGRVVGDAVRKARDPRTPDCGGSRTG